MELSILIARILAVVYLSAALGALLGKDFFRRISEDLFKNAALTYFMGLMTTVFGLIMVHHHNRWEHDWTVLITLISWAVLIKGVLFLVIPGFVGRLSGRMLTERTMKVFPFAAILLGLLFGYLGFCGRS
ncbi:MAG: hypothetical protein HY924_11555 [Elusimicrobia bacterium]|nr:hypothetical protein [Elusimicrobiota bacterium]